MAKRSDHPPIFSKRDKKHPIRGFFLWTLILVSLVVMIVFVINYGTNINVSVAKEKITLWQLTQTLKDLDGFTILHVSDLHAHRFRENQSAFKKAIDGLSYKAVVITGDMVGASGDYEPFLELLQTFKPGVPIYFIPGDSDPAPVLTTAHGSAGVLADYIAKAQELGAVYVDVPTALTVGKHTIWFCPENQYYLDAVSQANTYRAHRDSYIAMGQQNTPDGAANIRALEYKIDVMNRLSIASSQIKEDDLQIILTHHPLTEDYFRQMEGYESRTTFMTLGNAALSLAGHYNGGQWRYPWNQNAVYIPGLGAQPNERLYVGTSRVGGLTQYISPGLGSSSFYPYQPSRLFNPPTVTLITLSSK